MPLLFLVTQTPLPLPSSPVTSEPSVDIPSYDIWQTILGVVIFIALIGATYLVLRWLSKRTYGASKTIRILERSAINKDSYLMIAQVGTRYLVIGSSRDNLSLLCELSPEEFTGSATTPPDNSESPPDTQATNASFGQRFLHNIKVQTGVLPKDTPVMRPNSSVQQTATERTTPSVADGDPTPAQTAGSFAAVLQQIQSAEARQSTDGLRTDGLRTDDEEAMLLGLLSETATTNPKIPSNQTMESGHLSVGNTPTAPTMNPQTNSFQTQGTQAQGSQNMSPQTVTEPLGREETPVATSQNYDAAINALLQMGQRDNDSPHPMPVTHVAPPRAAAASYAAAVNRTPPVVPDQATDVLEALEEQRRQRDMTVPPVTVERPVPPAAPQASFSAVADDELFSLAQPVKTEVDTYVPREKVPDRPALDKLAQPAPEKEPEVTGKVPPETKAKASPRTSERQNAAQKLTTRNELDSERMDEMLDKIQQRSNRYAKHTKKK